MSRPRCGAFTDTDDLCEVHDCNEHYCDLDPGPGHGDLHECDCGVSWL